MRNVVGRYVDCIPLYGLNGVDETVLLSAVVGGKVMCNAYVIYF
jgi:hypothetical protein